MSRPIPSRPASWTLVLALAIVCSATIFGRSLSYPFVLDDQDMVRDNPAIRTFEPVRIFTTGAERHYVGDLPIDNYRPVGVLSLALDHVWSQSSPVGYRLTNLLLHAIAAALVVALARAVGLPEAAGWIAALLFAVHPIHTEAVVMIKGRLELLAAIFGMSAVVVEIGGAPGGVGSALASAGLFGLALLTKENGVGWLIVPPVLGVVRAAGGAQPRSALRTLAARAPRYVLWVAVAACVVAARYAVLGYLSPSVSTSHVDNPLAHVPVPIRMWNALGLVACYARLLLFPVQLSPDYSAGEIVPRVFPGGTANWIGLVLAIAAGALLIRALRRRTPEAAALAIVAGTYAPVSNLLVTFGTTMGERLAYQPSIGFALVAGAAILRCITHPTTRAARAAWWLGLALVVACFAGRSYLRIADWRSEDALWRSALQVVPESAKVLTYAAHEPLRTGDLTRARDLLTHALHIETDWDQPFELLARVELADRHPERALEAVAQLRRLRGPDEPTLHYLAGLALLQSHRPGDAAREFGEADRLFPQVLAAFNRAFALQQDGSPEALDAYLAAVGRYPSDARVERERERISALLGPLAERADGEEPCPGTSSWARAWLAYLASARDTAAPPARPACQPIGGAS